MAIIVALPELSSNASFSCPKKKTIEYVEGKRKSLIFTDCELISTVISMSSIAGLIESTDSQSIAIKSFI